MPEITIRPATIAAGDVDLFLDFWDSQIAWLQTVGSGAQWGSAPARESHPDAPRKMQNYISRGEDLTQPWSRDWCRAFAAEAQIGKDADSTLTKKPVAGIVLLSVSAEYVRDIVAEYDEDDPFIYVAFLMADRRAGDHSKGSGAALLSFAQGEAERMGVKRILLDCWSGNDGKLVQFYERQGFHTLSKFVARDWPGALLELRLRSE